jgi:hypothetical protein
MGKIIIQDHKRFKIMIPFLHEYPSMEEEEFTTKLTQFKDFNIKSKIYTKEILEEIKQLVETKIGGSAKVKFVRPQHNLIDTLVKEDNLVLEDEIEKELSIFEQISNMQKGKYLYK